MHEITLQTYARRIMDKSFWTKLLILWKFFFKECFLVWVDNEH